MHPAYTFIAEFIDGEQIWEYEGDRHVYTFQAVVDRVKAGHPLARLVLSPSRDSLKPVILAANGGKAIFFRRNYRGIGIEAAPTVTCIGFEKNIGGRVHKSLVFAFDDGSVLLTDDFNAV